MRKFSGAFILIGLVAGLGALSLLLGSKGNTIADVINALPEAVAIARGEKAADANASELAGIVATMRLPRTLLAVLAGGALGLAGAVMQALTRNPLADPGTLGVNAGASLAIVSGVYLFGVSTPLESMLLSFAGAALTATVVMWIARSSLGSGHPLGLLLAGAALAATLSAITSGIIYIDPQALDALRFWQAGSVARHGFDYVTVAAPAILLGAVICCALGPSLNLLSLGADTAKSLGTSVARTTVLGLVGIIVLTGAATAAVGPIAFIGLVVPHIVRAFTGPDFRWILPYSMFGGAVMLLAADILGRVIMRPGELQAGIVVAAVGAPAFIWLVRRRKMVAL